MKKEVIVTVDKEGISFGGRCWVSHSSIMDNRGTIFRNNYMDFVSEALGEEETPFKLNKEPQRETDKERE